MNREAGCFRIPRWLRTTAAVAVMLLCFFYLGRTLWLGARQVDWSELTVRPGPLILSAVLFTVATLIGGLCWSLLLEGLGQRQPLRANVKTHLRANVAKYLPGYAWQILGKAYLCRVQGLPMGPVGVGIGLEFITVILTGAWVALVTAPTAWLEALGAGRLIAWRWPLAVALGALLVGLPWCLSLVFERVEIIRRRTESIRIVARPLWWMLLWMLLAWLLLGLAVYGLIASLSMMHPGQWLAITSGWAASAILSLVVVFVPMGIGVKESALTFLLSPVVPTALAAVIAVLARVLTILGEALCFVIAQRL